MKRYITLMSVLISTYCLAQSQRHIDVMQQLPKNYVKDASVDYTSVLQDLVSRYDSIIMPNFPILINDKGIKISSNKAIVFQPKSMLKLKSSDKTHYALLFINKAENVRLYSPVLIGDRDKHIGDKGEWGMGIRIQGSNNVKIIKANISNFWGDGIYITRDKKVNSKNVLIDQSIIERNRRNGISVISGDSIFIQNSAFINNTGTNPMAGIDIEPNTPLDSLGYIKIKNIETTKNRVGVQVSMMHFPSEKKQTFRLDIEDVNSYKDQHGLLIRDFYRVERYGEKAIPLNGVVNYKNISIKESIQEPIKYFNSKEGYEYGPKYHFSNIKIKRDKNSQNWRSNNQIKNALKLRGFNVKNF